MNRTQVFLIKATVHHGNEINPTYPIYEIGAIVKVEDNTGRINIQFQLHSPRKKILDIYLVKPHKNTRRISFTGVRFEYARCTKPSRTRIGLIVFFKCVLWMRNI